MARSTRTVIIGLVAIGFGLYAFNLENALFWDDDDWILNNPAVHGLSWEHIRFLFSHDVLAGIGQTSNYYRPVLMLSFAFNWALGGPSPFGYHLLSNGLHVANAVLLFLLLSSLLRRSATGLRHPDAAAAVAALFWLVHPLHTEAVTYIAGRGDPLSVFFMLSALAVLLVAQGQWQTARRWPVTAYPVPVSLLLATLAILSRETAVLFPGFAVIVLMSFVCSKEGFGRSLRSSLTAVWPFIALSAGYMLLRATVLNFEDTFNWYRSSNVYSESVAIRTWTFLGALFDYVRLAFVPVGLHMERSVPVLTSPLLWPVPLVLGLLVLLAAQIVRQWRAGNRLWFFGSAWFLLALAPASGIAVPINALIYEHWLYLPLVGVATVSGVSAVRFYEWTHGRSSRPAAVLVCSGMCYVAFLGAQSVRRNVLWGDTERFYTQILHYEPESVRVLNNLANLYADRDDADQAEPYWRRAVEADPNQPAPYYNLANLARDRGDVAAAEQLYLTAIARQETFHYAYRNLVALLLDQQRLDDAAVPLRKLTELEPADPTLYFVQAQIYYSNGERALARAALEQGAPHVRSAEHARAYEELRMALDGSGP